MKEYFVSFSAAFFSTLSCCLLLYFNQVPLLSCLGGVVLAIVAYWRLGRVEREEADKTNNAAAMLLGWAFFFLVLAGPVFLVDYPMPSTAIVVGWGLGLVVGAVCHIYRKWIVTAASVAVWMAYVCIAIPAWFDYARKAKAEQESHSNIEKTTIVKTQTHIDLASEGCRL